MKKLISLLVILSIVLSITACGSTPSTSTKKENSTVYLNVGATSQSSGLYSYFVAVANGIKEGTNGVIQVSVVETGATIDNIKRLRSGSVDFALGTESENYKAYKGIGDWQKDGAFNELRGMYAYLPAAQPVVVTKESGVTNATELEGKRFFPGFSGSASEKASQEILGAIGIKPNYFHGSMDDGVKAVKDRNSVGFVKTGVGLKPDPTVVEINATLPLTIVGFTPDQIKKIKDLGYTTIVIPAGSYPNQEKDVETYVISINMITTTNLSQELVYEMMKNIIPNRDKHAEAYKGAAKDYVQATFDTQAIPLHAGAVKYYEEQGIKVPDNLIPPEYKK